jgi:hypothetical protein
MNINIVKEKRGTLIPIDLNDLPFQPKRIFFVTNVPKFDLRGEHAHYLTEQVLVCISGRIEVKLDYGNNMLKQVSLLPGMTIYITNKVWDTQKYLEDNTTICSICSTLYDKKDYITDYKKFINLTMKNDL